MSEQSAETPAKSEMNTIDAVDTAVTNLGAAILKLKTTGDAKPDQQAIEEVQDLYRDLRTRFDAYKASAQDQTNAFDDMMNQAQTAFGTFQQKMGEAVQSVQDKANNPENMDALKRSADDVGKGMTKAWNEVQASFGKAYERFRQSDTNDDTTKSASKSDPAAASKADKAD